MEIIRMIDTPEEKTGLAYGPELPLNFSIEGGTINMTHDPTKKPMDFYNDHENFEMDVRHEVDVTVRDYMYKHGMSDYNEAMKMVFEYDPELKEKYARS